MDSVIPELRERFPDTVIDESVSSALKELEDDPKVDPKKVRIVVLDRKTCNRDMLRAFACGVFVGMIIFMIVFTGS